MFLVAIQLGGDRAAVYGILWMTTRAKHDIKIVITTRDRYAWVGCYNLQERHLVGLAYFMYNCIKLQSWDISILYDLVLKVWSMHFNTLIDVKNTLYFFGYKGQK